MAQIVIHTMDLCNYCNPPRPPPPLRLASRVHLLVLLWTTEYYLGSIHQRRLFLEKRVFVGPFWNVATTTVFPGHYCFSGQRFFVRSGDTRIRYPPTLGAMLRCDLGTGSDATQNLLQKDSRAAAWHTRFEEQSPPAMRNWVSPRRVRPLDAELHADARSAQHASPTPLWQPDSGITSSTQSQNSALLPTLSGSASPNPSLRGGTAWPSPVLPRRRSSFGAVAAMYSDHGSSQHDVHPDASPRRRSSCGVLASMYSANGGVLPNEDGQFPTPSPSRSASTYVPYDKWMEEQAEPSPPANAYNKQSFPLRLHQEGLREEPTPFTSSPTSVRADLQAPTALRPLFHKRNHPDLFASGIDGALISPRLAPQDKGSNARPSWLPGVVDTTPRRLNSDYRRPSFIQETLAHTMQHCATPCARDDAPAAIRRGRSDVQDDIFPDLSRANLAARAERHKSAVDERKFFRATSVVIDAGSDEHRLRRAAEAAEHRNVATGAASPKAHTAACMDPSALRAAGVPVTAPWWLRDAEA